MIQCNDIILAYSNNAEIRRTATSGGIGSSLVHRLFAQGMICSAMSYAYDKEELKYVPQIVKSSEEYVVSGSIYHEINLYAYIREHIDEIKSPFLCFALPCQVNSIKALLDKHGVESYIVELTCSSQQTFEATEYLLKRVGVVKSDVSSIRYRGDGWPGGVCITMKNGEEMRIPNNDSVWMRIFHSHLFIMSRCFFCQAGRETVSDIKLADPWGIDSPALEKLGRTLCQVKSEWMATILNGMANEGLISYECRSVKEFLQSQYGTIIRKNYNIRHSRFTKIVKSVLHNKVYRKIVLGSPFLFDAHCFLYSYGCRCLYKIDQILGRK